MKPLTQGHTAEKAGFKPRSIWPRNSILYWTPRIGRLYIVKNFKENPVQYFIMLTEKLRPREGKELCWGRTAITLGTDSWLPEVFRPHAHPSRVSTLHLSFLLAVTELACPFQLLEALECLKLSNGSCGTARAASLKALQASFQPAARSPLKAQEGG